LEVGVVYKCIMDAFASFIYCLFYGTLIPILAYRVWLSRLAVAHLLLHHMHIEQALTIVALDSYIPLGACWFTMGVRLTRNDAFVPADGAHLWYHHVACAWVFAIRHRSASLDSDAYTLCSTRTFNLEVIRQLSPTSTITHKSLLLLDHVNNKERITRTERNVSAFQRSKRAL